MTFIARGWNVLRTLDSLRTATLHLGWEVCSKAFRNILIGLPKNEDASSGESAWESIEKEPLLLRCVDELSSPGRISSSLQKGCLSGNSFLIPSLSRNISAVAHIKLGEIILAQGRSTSLIDSTLGGLKRVFK